VTWQGFLARFSGKVLATSKSDLLACASTGHWSARMRHQRDETARDVELRDAARISALITDLNRIGRLLDGDIAREEADAAQFNPSNAAYPIAARILRARRANLANTITSLETRLASLLERSERTDDWAPAPHLGLNTKRNAGQASH
jgi:hypothetical protein